MADQIPDVFAEFFEQSEVFKEFLGQNANDEMFYAVKGYVEGDEIIENKFVFADLAEVLRDVIFLHMVAPGSPWSMKGDDAIIPIAKIEHFILDVVLISMATVYRFEYGDLLDEFASAVSMMLSTSEKEKQDGAKRLREAFERYKKMMWGQDDGGAAVF